MTLVHQSKSSGQIADGATLAGIFLISCAALMFEISLTRLLSITYWYHYAFLIISCALLGYGSAGSLLAVFNRPVTPCFQALLFSAGLLPLYAISIIIPFDPVRLPLENVQWLYLAVLFFIMSVPFFFCGTTINLILRQYSRDPFRIYCFDLLGAGAGCLFFFIIASHYSGPEWLVIVSFIGILSSVFLAEKPVQIVVVVITACFISLVLLISGLPEQPVSPYKSLPLALKYPGSRITGSAWNSVTRVDWFKSPLARFAPGLSLNYRGQLPEQTGITIDGDGLTAHTEWDLSRNRFMESLPSWIPYRLTPEPNSTLILQVVGGLEVNVARWAEVPIVAAQSESRLAADWLLRQPGMENLDLQANTARTYLSRLARQFDRIIISLEGALPTGGSGTSVLQESSLLTIEGIQEILLNLNDNGWLIIHQYLLPPPRAEIRMLATLIEAARKLDWPAEKRIGVFRSVSTITMLISAGSWTETNTREFNQFCSERGYTPVYYPGMEITSANRVNRFPQAIYAKAAFEMLDDPATFHRFSMFDLQPVTDDRPFFYDFLRFRNLDRTYQLMDRKWEALIEMGLLLPSILAGVTLIAAILILWPLLVTRKITGLLNSGFLMFLLIGFGFMAVEIAFIERLILLFGDPSYSFAVVLGSLLLFTGLGSGLSRHFGRKAQLVSGGCLVAILMVYAVFFTTTINGLIRYSFQVRILVAMILIGLPAILMGMPFPVGIKVITTAAAKTLKESQVGSAERRVAVAWCLNSFASVVGAVGAMFLAQVWGFSFLLFCSALVYAFAFLFLIRL